jgi:hypothetical protein
LPAFNANSIFINVLNAGLEYKNTTIDADRFAFYLGAGAGPFMQLQVGFSDGGLSSRVRCEIPLGIFNYDSDDANFFMKYMTISFNGEKYFADSNKFSEMFKDIVWGIGVGFVLDPLWRDWPI